MLSLSATTTTITVTVAPTEPTRFSWPAMSHDQWPCPELSIGLPLKPLGRYKCWSVQDKSPAASMWKTVCRPIISLLEDQYEHLNIKDSELKVDVFMIGRKAASSVPTVLFSCEAKSPRRKAMDLVKKKGILDFHPGVQMGECSRLPKQLALGEETELLHLPSGVYVDGQLRRSCGIAVLISRDNSTLPRKATIGGIVCVGDDYYGLTVAHAFDEVEKTGTSSDEDFEFAFYGLGQSADSSDDEDNDMITSRGSISSSSSTSPNSDETEGFDITFPLTQGPAITKLTPGITGTHQKQSVTKPVRFGSLFASSAPDDTHDWALVKFESPDIIQSTNQCSNLTISKVRTVDQGIDPESFPGGGGGRVLVCLGSSETAVEGILSEVPSFLKTSGKKVFQKLWQVKRFDGDFVDGDCGSWVVDSETGDLFGQLVSGYSGTQIGYIIPAEQIFRNISERFGRPVKLSTNSKKTTRTSSRGGPQAVQVIERFPTGSLPLLSYARRQGEPPPLPTSVRCGPPPPPPPPPLPLRYYLPRPSARSPEEVQLSMPTRIDAKSVVNMTPRKPLDEETYLKEQTSYEVYTIRKLIPRDFKDRATWAKTQTIKELLSQEDILKRLKRLNESEDSLQDKKAALMPFLQLQIDRLLNDLKASNPDLDFEWNLVNIDRKDITDQKGQSETIIITAYFRRALLYHRPNPFALHNAIEINRQQESERFNRPSPRPEIIRVLPPPEPLLEGDTSAGNVTSIKKVTKLPRLKKKYNSDDSSVSSTFSDSDTSSGYSSEGNTTISTHSKSRRYSRGKLTRGRDHSRQGREPPKTYQDPMQPHSHIQIPPTRYIPGIPQRSIQVSGFDAIELAYQAGRADAETERFDRLDHCPRTAIAEARTVVSNGRPLERDYQEPRYPDPRSRYEDRRHVENYVDDLRVGDLARTENISQDVNGGDERRQAAEEYTEWRTAKDYRDRRAVEEFVNRRPGPSDFQSEGKTTYPSLNNVFTASSQRYDYYGSKDSRY